MAHAFNSLNRTLPPRVICLALLLSVAVSVKTTTYDSKGNPTKPGDVKEVSKEGAPPPPQTNFSMDKDGVC